MMLIIIAIVGTACWYLRSVLAYIALALVVSLLALPFRRLFAKIHFGKYQNPDWLCAIMAISTVFLLMMSLSYLVVPLVNDVSRDIRMANLEDLTNAVSVPLNAINEWIEAITSGLETEINVESVIFNKIQDIMNGGTVSNVVGGVTGFVMNLGVTAFSVIFISFFFIKTPSLFENIVKALVSDDDEERVHKSLHEIVTLLTRYFTGVSLEVACVWLINFIGLWAIARMGFKYSIGIAFLAGVLNIVPYIGPLIGGALGVSMSLIIHYATAGIYGLDLPIIGFVLVLIGIFVFAQLIDNYILQPVIYSNSVQAHPLEIFIVFLIAGQIGGMAGMIAAVPAYTVFRVIAREFFTNIKPIRRLTGGE